MFAPPLAALLLTAPQAPALPPPSATSTPRTQAVWGDVDGDGFADLLLLCPNARDRLLRNLGDGRFEDVTELALNAREESATAAWIEDFDADGLCDVLRLDARGELCLERNEGALCFADRTASSGLAAIDPVRSLRLFDYDRDGRPDLLLSTDAGEAILHNSVSAGFEPVALPGALWSAPEEGGGLFVAAGAVESTPAGTGVSAEEPGRRRGAGGPTTPGGAGAPGAPATAGPPYTITPQSQGTVPASPPPTLTCADSLVDQALPGGTCLQASSQPLMDHLYPLSTDFNVSSAGFVGMGTNAPLARLHVVHDGTLKEAVVIDSTSSSTWAGLEVSAFRCAIAGTARATSGGTTWGVHGAAASPDGSGVKGFNMALTGSSRGVWGETSSPSGIGVDGTGGHIGVHGSVDNANGYGVQGESLSQTGQGTGVYGTADSPGGAGVRGANQALAGSTRGVQGYVLSPDGVGVLGESDSLTGDGVGVLGLSDSTTGMGVNGRNASLTGLALGVLGEVQSADGVGVFGRSLDTTSNGVAYGVRGEVRSFGGAGVLGLSLNTTGAVSGVEGLSSSPEGRGVAGRNDATTGLALGVTGEVQSPDGIGVFGRALDTTGSGTTYGVRGDTSSPSGAGVAGSAFGASGTANGVSGSVESSPSGVAVYGLHEGTTGFATALKGESDSSSGIGVWGIGDYAGVYGRGPTVSTGTTIGVYGRGEDTADHIGVVGTAGAAPLLFNNSGVSGATDRGDGYAVAGNNTATTGRAHGVYGRSHAASGEGVEGEGWAGVAGRQIVPSGGGYGVAGFASNTQGVGVVGAASSATVSTPIYINAGVSGVTEGPAGAGVAGVNAGANSNAVGVFGESLSSAGGYGVYGKSSAAGIAVFSEGDLTVGGGGTKSFVHPHPHDASKQVRFVCLEGNESGTYFRGTAALVGGAATIAVPEAFRLVTDAEGITVQVTPMGPAALWILHQGLDTIEVRGNVDVEFNYFVNGVRAGHAGFEPIEPNVAYRPELHGVPYAAHMDPYFQNLLIENGTLNPDLTPDLGTAVRLGWQLRDGEVERAATLAAHARPASETMGAAAQVLTSPPTGSVPGDPDEGR